MVPSFARGAADFTLEFGSDLAERVAETGYKVVLPDPRGFGSPVLAEVTMEDIAADVAAVVEKERGDRQVSALGHAFGNRVVRMLAATQRANAPRGCPK